MPFSGLNDLAATSRGFKCSIDSLSLLNERSGFMSELRSCGTKVLAKWQAKGSDPS